MEPGCPLYIILCVLLMYGLWSINAEKPSIKLPCFYGGPHVNLLDQPSHPKHSWIVLEGRQDIHEENVKGVKFFFKDSPVSPMAFLKEDLKEVKCDIKPYFTANTQILWPGVNTDDVLDSWYIYSLKHNGGKFHASIFFTKLSGTAEKKESDEHHVLATFMLSTKTPHVYTRLLGSVLLDCAFTVDHRADVTVTWSYRGRGSPEEKILSYNGLTKKLQNNWKDASMSVEQLQKGNASLLVTNVSLKSEGIFVCAVSVASLFGEQQIHLQIREIPMVSLNVDSVVTLRDGDEQTFVCAASSYYPLDVNIEWLREQTNTGFLPSLMSSVIYSSHRKNHDGTYSLSGSFYYVAALKDDGVTFTCRVEHESLKKPIRKTVTIIVLDSLAWNLIIFLIILLILLLFFCVRMYQRVKNANKPKPY